MITILRVLNFERIHLTEVLLRNFHINTLWYTHTFNFTSVYLNKSGSQDMILRLIEEWKEKLDKGLFAGATLMNLSKTFSCIPHDLPIANLNAYGFDRKSPVFFYSYLKRRKQCVNINNIVHFKGHFLGFLKDWSLDHCYLICL